MLELLGMATSPFSPIPATNTKTAIPALYRGATKSLHEVETKGAPVSAIYKGLSS